MNYVLNSLVLFFCLHSLSAQTVLQYSLKKDDAFIVEQHAEQIIIQELEGMSHKITNDINSILEFKVLEERDSVYNMALTFKDLNLKMTSNIQGELMNVNAKGVNEDDMQSKIFGALLENPVQIVLAKNGDILEVVGGNSLIAKMTKASGLKDESLLDTMKKSLEQEFGSEALSNSYEQMTFIYPKTSVKVGDSWENQYTGKLSANTIWTLDALSQEKINISGTASTTMNVSDMDTTMDLSGTQRTNIEIDPSNGFLVSMRVEGQLQGTSIVTQLEGQKIPTNVKSMTTYELIESSIE